MISLADLTWDPGFWYVGSPYSKAPGGPAKAFEDISRITGQLILRHVPCFSPIAHSHPISVHANIDPLDHKIWLPADQPMMDAAIGLIVVEMDGWRESFGLAHEIDAFSKAGKTIVYLDPVHFSISESPHERNRDAA